MDMGRYLVEAHLREGARSLSLAALTGLLALAGRCECWATPPTR
jgi:hypothetical protein